MLQLGVVWIIVPRANINAVFLLPTKVLLEIVYNNHSLDVSTNSFQVFNVLSGRPAIIVFVVVMVDRYGVLSVQSVSHCTFNIEFVEHFVRILKVVRVNTKICQLTAYSAAVKTMISKY